MAPDDVPGWRVEAKHRLVGDMLGQSRDGIEVLCGLSLPRPRYPLHWELSVDSHGQDLTSCISDEVGDICEWVL